VVLRQVDRWLGLTKSLAKHLPDQRDPDNVEHRMGEKIRPEQVPGFNLPNLGDGGVGYRDALFVNRLYGSGCKEIVPFNGSNSGSL
jgi:hypothetical protein